jgi:integrase
MNTRNSYVEVRKGVKLYQRDDAKKGVWNCYIRLNGRTYRSTTGETDLDEAKLVASHGFKEIRDHPERFEVSKASFGVVAKRWLKTKQHHSDLTNKAQAVTKFVAYFDGVLKLNDVRDIRQKHVTDYLTWRKNLRVDEAQARFDKKSYQRNGKIVAARQQRFGVAKNNTLNRENQSLRQILRFAAAEGHIDGARLPTVETLPSDGERRPNFTPDQEDRLFELARERVKAAGYERLVNDRQTLCDHIVLLRYTGLRSHEAVGLRWTDIDFDARMITVRKGKTGSRVVAILFDELLTHLKYTQQRRKEYAKAHDQTFSDNEHVTVKPDGTPIKSVKKALGSLIEASGFVAPGGKRHSSYSFRHSFATNLARLGMPDALRSKIMGTSREMLDLHYDHTTAIMALQWMEQKSATEATNPASLPPPALVLESPHGPALKLGTGGVLALE